MRRFISLLFTLSICFFSSHAVEHRQLMKDLDFEVKLTGLILEMGQEISREIPNSPNHNLSHQEIIDLLHNKAVKYAVAYDSYYAAKYQGQYEKGSFTKLIRKINWHEIFLATKEHLKNSAGIIKLYGAGYILAFMVGTVIEYASYYFLALFNLKILLSAAVFIPYGNGLLIFPLKYEEFVHRKKMREILGGKEKYNAFVAYRKELRDNLKLTSPKKILYPLIEGLEEKSIKAAAISPKSSAGKLLSSAKRAMGFETIDLDYQNIKLFLKNHSISNQAIDYILDSPMPEYIKTGLISQNILESSNSNIRSKFLSHFNEFLVDIKPQGHRDDVKKWLKEMYDKPSVEKIRRLMANLPEGVEPKMVAQAWDKFILPHYSREFNISYFQYRRLKQEVLLFKDQVLQKENINQEEFFEIFDKHLTKALKFNLKQCEVPEETVLKVLLRGSL